MSSPAVLIQMHPVRGMPDRVEMRITSSKKELGYVFAFKEATRMIADAMKEAVDGEGG
mgnify:CR=1 FL=1